MKASRTRRAWFAALLALALGGCASWRIDPSGQRLFLPDGSAPRGSTAALEDSYALRLTPKTIIAPVGAEVVLIASVCAPDGYMRTNERVEWSIAPASVGHFTFVGRNGLTDWLAGQFWRGKVDNTYAIGTTAHSAFCLTRGTPTTADDVQVLRGQAWAAVTSPLEGTSQVTALVPSAAWQGRKQTSSIHWIDAQWQFPPPAINAAGTRHVFTTTVVRCSDQAPCIGWLVHYEIADGPPAGFAPSGARAIQVETNAAGQACAEISQPAPVSGVNRVLVRIVRPATASGAPPLNVAEGSTSKTWTTPQIALDHTGPAAASVGGTIAYRLAVTNPGDLPAEGIVLTDDLPPQVTLVSSTPPAEVSGRKLRWNLGRLSGHEQRTVEVAVRADQKGTITACAEATAAGNLRASQCVTTTVGAPAIELSMVPPPQTTVGGTVAFEMVITNRSAVAATDLVITDTFDAGLEHAVSTSPIERDLKQLGPGESQRLRVAFRATRPGTLCHTVSVSDRTGVLASGKSCVNVAAEASPPQTRPAEPPATPPREQPKEPPAKPTPKVVLKKTGPTSVTAGEIAEFKVVVTNPGPDKLSDVRLAERLDAALKPSMATAGWVFEGEELVWRFKELLPDKPIQVVLQAQTSGPTPRACNRASVRTAEGATAEAEACLEIRQARPEAKPPRGDGPILPGTGGVSAAAVLTMSVADLRESVPVGNPFTYEIIVTNKGVVSDSQLALAVTLPKELLFVGLGTTGPTGLKREGSVVRFDPVAELRPGQSLTYRVRVQAREAGQARLVAELTSRAHVKPVRVEETTDLYPARGG